MTQQVSSLGDGSLPNFFLQASTSSFTGVFRVDADTSQGRETLLIGIREGQVLQVDSPTRSDAWRLGQLVADADLCSEQAVEEALLTARTQQRPLGDVLVELRSLEPKQLEELLHLQFVEDLHRCLGWRRGEVRIESRDILPRPRGISLSLETVAQVGTWQLDQWPTLRMLVATNAMSFEKTFSGAVPRKLVESAQLGRQELMLFSLVHPSRDITALVRLARLETFEVCRSLGLLSQAGAVRVHGAAPERRQAVARVSRGLVQHVATAVLICLVMGLSLFLWMSSSQRSDHSLSIGEVNPWHDALTSTQMARIQNALGVYRARHGDYPARLAMLVGEGLLTDADLIYPSFENPYTYRKHDDNFILVQPKR